MPLSIERSPKQTTFYVISFPFLNLVAFDIRIAGEKFEYVGHDLVRVVNQTKLLRLALKNKRTPTAQ